MSGERPDFSDPSLATSLDRFITSEPDAPYLRRGYDRLMADVDSQPGFDADFDLGDGERN